MTKWFLNCIKWETGHSCRWIKWLHHKIQQPRQFSLPKPTNVSPVHKPPKSQDPQILPQLKNTVPGRLEVQATRSIHWFSCTDTVNKAVKGAISRPFNSKQRWSDPNSCFPAQFLESCPAPSCASAALYAI